MEKKESMKPPQLSKDQIERYSRQILLKEIGTKGMQKLLQASIMIVGGGGLGCPAIQILAGVGIRHIKVIDNDAVSLSNLPRQILHNSKDVGRYKVDSIHDKVRDINPDVLLEPIRTRLTRDNIGELLKKVDYVIEASDNLATKFLVNDACVHFNVPFTIAGVMEYGGQVLSVIPRKSTCYRCVFTTPLEGHDLFTCNAQGILATASMFGGTLEANEAIKAILGLPNRLIDKMLTFDLSKYAFNLMNLKQDPNCVVCAHPDKPYFINTKYNSEEIIDEK